MGKEIQQVALNLLSEGTRIEGDISATNDIRVDGIVKGNIKTSGRVVIGPTAKIEGNIESPGVDLIGTAPPSTRHEFEAGAVFNGECHIAQETSKTKNHS